MAFYSTAACRGAKGGAQEPHRTWSCTWRVIGRRRHRWPTRSIDLQEAHDARPVRVTTSNEMAAACSRRFEHGFNAAPRRARAFNVHRATWRLTAPAAGSLPSSASHAGQFVTLLQLLHACSPPRPHHHRDESQTRDKRPGRHWVGTGTPLRQYNVAPIPQGSAAALAAGSPRLTMHTRSELCSSSTSPTTPPGRVSDALEVKK